MSTLINKGQEALNSGEYQKALDLFQKVVQQLQSMLSESIERFFPEAFSGWDAGEIESQSWAGATEELAQRSGIHGEAPCLIKPIMAAT
jgi:hypothetical protein